MLDRIHHVSGSPERPYGPLQTLASGFGSIWTIGPRAVVRIDPSTDRPVARIEMPYPVALVAGMGAVWVAGGRGAIRLIRIDPTDDSVRDIKGPQASAAGIAAGEGEVWWINSSEASSISAIDPTAQSERYVPTPFYVAFMIPTPDGVWLIDSGGQVARIPAGSFEPGRRVRKAPQVIGVDLSGDTVWMNTGDLVGFDAKTGRVVLRRSVSGHPPPQVRAGVAQLGSRVWVVDIARQRIVGVTV